MRFKKASLVAASLLLSSLPAFAADAFVGPDYYNTSLIISLGDRVIFDDGGSFGRIEELFGGGDFVKQGTGVMQYDGFINRALYDAGEAPNLPRVSLAAEARTPLPRDSIPGLPGYIHGSTATTSALTGVLRVEGGTFIAAGSLNAWVQHSHGINDRVSGGGLPANDAYMDGVSGVILSKGTSLSFTNTPQNVVSALAKEFGGRGGRETLRYNMVRNIKSGENNDIADTTFVAGADSSYRIVIYSDNTQAAITAEANPNGLLTRLGAAGNSIGRLAGQGDVYKYGAADLKILGDSERGIGRVIIADGSVTLASPTNAALATAQSINLAGVGALNGENIRFQYKQVPGNANGKGNDWWKNAYAPEPGTGRLILENDQTIRNLQADFAYAAGGATVREAISNASAKTNEGDAVIAGTGAGSTIQIAATTETGAARTLTVIQDRDGVYEGNILGRVGDRFVKTGTGTLVLQLGLPTNVNVAVNQGVLLANAQGLGMGDVDISGTGTLAIFQTNAGTLNARISGSGSLDILASAFVNNGSGPIQVNSEGVAGSLSFGRKQDSFTGVYNVRDGVRLTLSSSAADAISTASGVRLFGATGKTTSIYVADVAHHIKRLEGETGTRLDLGNGALIVDQTGDALTFGGDTVGAGTLIQSGGDWTLNGASIGHTGALVVQGSGKFTQSGTAGMSLVSGLVLSGGSTFVSGGLTTAVGALFGQSGSVVELGAGDMIVGLGEESLLRLRQDLAASQRPLSSNYLGTSATAVDLGGVAISAFDDSLAVPSGRTLPSNLVLRTGQLLPVGLVLPVGTAIPVGVPGANYEVRADGTILIRTNTTLPSPVTLPSDMLVNVSLQLLVDNSGAGVAGATRAFLTHTVGWDAASANALAFSGDIRGTGNLIKRGGETLSLSGVNTYTGGTRVEGGTLRVNWNSINATSGVTLYTGTTLEINADAASGDGEFTRSLTSVTDAAGNPITGAGLVRKVGAGRVILTGDLSGFLGGFDVAAGTLQVNEVGSLSGAVDIRSGATMVFNQSIAATASGSVTNAGILEKQGSGSLTLGAYSGTGQVNVRAGTLALTNFPAGGLDVSAGATFASTISGSVTCSTMVTGTGTVRLLGSGTGATLVAGANNLFRTITLDLRRITFDLNGTTQTLGGFSGGPASLIDLDGGALAFDTPSGIDTVFIGNVTGAGAIVKSGAGTVTLGTTTVQNWTGTVTVSEGTLVATPQALGGQNSTNSVTLVTSGATYGTFALHNADTTSAQVYGGSVGGQGVLAKTGAGEVVFNQGLSGFTSPGSGVAAVQVREGRLTTGDLGSDAVFTSVSVAQGASLRVNMSGARVLDASVADTLRGEGDLVVAGSQTLTLANGQNYTGLTELLDGATLAFSNTPVIHGIKGDAGTTIALSGDLRVNQAVSAAFAGVFSGSGTLTVGGAGTLDLSLAGASGDLAGLSLAVASGGTVRVGAANTQAIVNDGTLEITDSGAVSARYVAAVSGSGLVTKVGAGKLSFGDGVTSGVTGHPYVLGSTGGLLVKEGVLGGCFEVRGGLAVASGATLSPGNSPGVVTVATGDFNLAAGSTLLLEVNALTSDKVEVLSGAAILAGKLRVTQDSTVGSAKAAGGQKFTVVSATGGFTGAFSNSTNGFVFLDAADKVATGLDRVHLDKVGNNLVMTAVAGLSDIDGFAPHDGLGGFIAMLDAKGAPVSVQTAVDTLWGAGINSALTNLSPLGYAAEYAMAQDGEARRQALLHDRMEQRRYDRGSPLTTEDAPWEAFVVGGGSFVNNKAATDTPVFDYRTFGGLVGLDCKTADGLLLGAAIGYDSGKSTLKDNGGKVDMDRMAATLFMSTQLTSRWYLDVGATAGVGLYDSKRTTVAGNAEGDNVGFSGGLTAETGTVIALSKELHLTPYLAAVYTHHEFGSIDETGSDAALNVDSWSQDSLRAKVGTGLGWFLPTDWARLKLGLDVAYAHELLDTESKFGARFASAPGSKFDATAAALPKDSISLSPSLGLQFDESTSATLSYTYEMGLDSRSYQSVNFAIRKRF